MHEAFTTDRLQLRPLRATDATDFARLADNPKICRMTGSFPSPFPAVSVAGMIDIFLARAATGKAYHWAILEHGTFAGAIGLYRTEGGWDVGYWLGEPFWGHGYGSEILAAMVAYLGTHQPEAVLTACVFTDNPASARILRKAGFDQAATTCQGYSLARRSHVPNWTFSRQPGHVKAVAPAILEETA